MIAFFAPRRRKQPPARAKNAPIRPTDWRSLLKEDFALARIGIKPACQQGDVILQISKSSSAGGWAALAGFASRSYRFEEFAQPLFRGSRLRRGIGKFEDKRVYDLSAAYPENSNGAFRLRTHDDYRMKLFDRTNDIRKSPLQILDSFQAFVQGGGLLEIEFGAGRFPLAGQGIGKRTPSRTQISSRAAHLFRIFGNGAPSKAGRQAHFHLGIDASGEIGIAADFDLAAANSKKIEPTFQEAFRCAAGGKGTQIQTRGAQTASDIGTRISVRQIQLYERRRVETQALAIVSRPQNSRLLPMHQGLLEPRTGNSKTNAGGILPQIEALTIRFRFAEQKPQAPPQIRGAQQKRASAGQTWTGFDQNDRRTRGNAGEKLFRPA